MESAFLEMNVTFNTTGEDVEHDIWSTPIGVFAAVFMTLTIVLNLLLNPFMLVALHRAKGIKSSTKVFLASLTVSDLLTGVSEAFLLTQLYTGVWLMGDFLCTAITFLSSAFYNVSIMSIFLLTIERFIAISYPLHYPRLMTTQRSKITVCSCWAATILMLTVIFGIDFKYMVNDGLCWYEPRQYDWRIYFGGSIFIILILVTIIILYVRISLIAHRHSRDTTTVSQTNGNPGNHRQINTRATITIIIITGTLIVTWIPTIVFTLTATNEVWDFKTIKLVDALMLSNSWLNVVIYYLRNQNLRQALRGLLSSKYTSS